MRKGIRGVPATVAGLALLATAGLFASPSVGWAATPQASLLASSASSIFGPAYQAMTSANTARVTLHVGGSTAVNGTGQCEFKIHYCYYAIKVAIPGVGSEGASTPQTIIEVLDGTKIYTKYPGGLGGTKAKPWVEESSSASVGSSANEDPSQVLMDLDKYATGVHKIGSPTIGGVSTTEYAATFNQASVPGATADQKALGPVPVLVWLDGKHRIVQIGESLSGSASSATTVAGSPPTTASAITDFTISFSHYGESVKVVIPPASQVTKE